jgi:hypothetical protein
MFIGRVKEAGDDSLSYWLRVVIVQVELSCVVL